LFLIYVLRPPRSLFTRQHVVSNARRGNSSNYETAAEGRANMGNSGIFGYVNYLVEKDRKTILDTLVNGMSTRDPWAPTRPTTSASS
jgi:hypothetical protein